MYLRKIHISNFKAIQDAWLTDLRQVNVLVGRNNAGKSTVLGAIAAAAQACTSRPLVDPPPSWPESNPYRNPMFATKMELSFEVEERERQFLINAVFQTHGSETWPKSKLQLIESPFAKFLTLRLESENTKPDLQIADIEIQGEDGEPEGIIIQKGTLVVNVVDQMRNVLAKGDEVNRLSIRKDRGSTHPQGVPRYNFLENLAELDGGEFGISLAVSYFNRAFCFPPYRRSEVSRPVRQEDHLSADGSNLASVLNTFRQNEDSKFAEIESLFYAALPDVGVLRAPLNDDSTLISLRRPENPSFSFGIRDVGGGVEQLLMLITAIVSIDDAPVLLLEEPEAHLHPAAQRFVMDLISERSHQSILTTHSPVLVSPAPNKSVYRIELVDRKTCVSTLGSKKDLGTALVAIGARNSDVLLSDRVLFVEGGTDERVLHSFAIKLAMNLDTAGITIVTTGGAEFAGRSFPARSDVLEQISRHSVDIPHWFLIDRDERSDVEIERLTKQLGQRIHVLQRREIENYLLIPPAIITAVEKKYGSNNSLLEHLGSISDEIVQKWLDDAAADLRNLILCKRVRSNIGGLREGLMPRAKVLELASATDENNLVEGFRELIGKTWQQEVETKNIEQAVQDAVDALDKVWQDPIQRLAIAPGHEVLQIAFRRFSILGCDVGYDKAKDVELLAESVPPELIDPELVSFIGLITGPVDAA